MKRLAFFTVGLLIAISLFTACNNEKRTTGETISAADVDAFMASEVYQTARKSTTVYTRAIANKVRNFSTEESERFGELLQESVNSDDPEVRLANHKMIKEMLGEEVAELEQVKNEAWDKVKNDPLYTDAMRKAISTKEKQLASNK